MPAKMTLSSGLLLAVVFIASGALSDPSRRLNPTRPKAFDYAADAERVVGELHHNFSCDGREYGYYADQGQQCQVFHICMPVKTVTGRILDTFQFSFFCPNQTRFSQDSRTCINEAQAYPCHKAHTLYDLNKAIGHRPNKKKRPVNLKDRSQGNFKTNVQVTQSASLGNVAGGATETTFLKESFDDSSFVLESFDDSTVGLSVQEGVTPVHADSTVAIGAPAVAVPPSADNAGTTTTFAGRFQPSSTAAPPVGDFVSNDLSEHSERPEFVIPPGSQIISTQSIQHQNALSQPARSDGSVSPARGNTRTSRINVSAHGSSGFSNAGPSTQAPTLTSSSFPSTVSSTGTPPLVHSIVSTTPHTSFTTNEEFGPSGVTSANQDSSVNSGLNSIAITNRGNSFTSTESSVSFRPIPQRNREPVNAVSVSGNSVGSSSQQDGSRFSNSHASSQQDGSRFSNSHASSQQDASRFSNSHTLEAASHAGTGTSTGTSTSSAGRGQISTFASRARAHSTQSFSHQASQSSDQRSQSFSFSQNIGNDGGITSQPIITTHQSVSQAPQLITTTQKPVPSLSQQFTPPPISQAAPGTSRPLQIPGFSSGISRNLVAVQNQQDDNFANQQLSTLSSFPTTTEYFEEGDGFPTTVITEIPFESSRAIFESNNIQPPSLQNVGSLPNRGSARKVTVQRRPIQEPSIDQVSSRISNVHSTASVNTGNVNGFNSFSNNNRATTRFDQNTDGLHTGVSPVSSGISNSLGSVTPSPLGHSISVQTPTIPSLSVSTSEQNTPLSINSEHLGIHSQNELEGTQNESHGGHSQTISVQNSSFRGSTTSRISSQRNRGNQISSSRGLRTQITATGTERSSEAVVQTSGTANVDRGSVRGIPSQSVEVTEEKAALNTVTSNRGSPRRISQPIFEDRTPRPVTSNRGSRKFQPSTYLLQSAGFHNPQWQPVQNQNTLARNSVSRSRSRSQNGNTSNGVQTSSVNQNDDGNDSSGTAVQEDSVSTSFDNTRVSTSEISHRTVSGVELPKQNSIVSHDISKQSSSVTATTFKPVTQALVQSTSRGRAFGSQDSSNNLLSSQQNRSGQTQSSYGAPSTFTTESSVTSQYGNSETVTRSQSVTSRPTTPASRQLTTTSFATSAIPRRQPITSNANLLRQTGSAQGFSRSDAGTSSETLHETTQNTESRKVIKKKIIVNGRPGSRKSHEPTESTTKAEIQKETNEEEEKKRQRALDALERFSPGFANANLLAFRVIPNGVKKNSVQQVSTTEATVQQTPKPQNSFNNQRRGGSRARITTTPTPVTTTQSSQFISRTSSRRVSRPVTQTTTAEPIATTISPLHGLRSNDRRVVNEQQAEVSENSALSQTSGSSSISSQSAASSSRHRGNTKFTSSVNNSRRRIVKKITPVSENSASSKNLDSSVPSFDSSKASSSVQAASTSLAKQASQSSRHSSQPLEKPSGQLRVVGTSIESSVSSNLGSEKSISQASSSLSSSSTSSSSPSPRSRFNSRSRSSSSFPSRNTGNLVVKQGAGHEPLTDLELEALSALAQVNSAFSNAAKSQLQPSSSSRGTRRRDSTPSRSRSRSL